MRTVRSLFLVAVFVATMAGPALPIGSADVSETGANVVIRPDGRVALDIPVQVVLVGFPSSMPPALASRLAPQTFDHEYNSAPWSLDPEHPRPLPAWSQPPLPFLPTARYSVGALSPAGSAAVESATVAAAENPWQSDGNAVEEAIRSELVREGFVLRADLPMLVVVHRGEANMGHAGYVYRAESGWVENARFFGGLHPFLVLDVSAAPDPDATYGSQGRAYERPLAPVGEATLAALDLAIEDATRVRLLPDLSYSTPARTCQAVTVLLAVRATSGEGLLPMMGDPDETVDPARLRDTFAELTGGQVFVDLVRIDLPVDDPALDAIARAVSGTTMTWHVPGVSSGTSNVQNAVFELARTWIEVNWDRYHVPHEGCEPFLSVAIWGDVADSPYEYGFALHGEQSGHRFSFSSVGWMNRLAADPGPTPVTWRDPSRGFYDPVDAIVAHETGHLLGLHHTHHDPADAWSDVWAFGKTLSIMGYPWQEKTVQFGAIDRANFARNQASFALDAVRRAGDLATPEAQEALGLLEAWRWNEATLALRPILRDPPAPPPEPLQLLGEWTCAPEVDACAFDYEWSSAGCSGGRRATGVAYWGEQGENVAVSGLRNDCPEENNVGQGVIVWIDPAPSAPVGRAFVAWWQGEDQGQPFCNVGFSQGSLSRWLACPLGLAPPDPGWGSVLP